MPCPGGCAPGGAGPASERLLPAGTYPSAARRGWFRRGLFSVFLGLCLEPRPAKPGPGALLPACRRGAPWRGCRAQGIAARALFWCIHLALVPSAWLEVVVKTLLV